MAALFKQTKRVWPQAIKQVACYSSSPTIAAMQENIVEVKKPEKKRSERFIAFQKKLRSKTPFAAFDELSRAPYQVDEAFKPWPNNTNPHTGEIGGPAGPEPTRYGDWEYKGRVTDF